MFSTHTQLVKWTLPACAVIIGLLWYKRRQADRVDPGGTDKKSHSKENIADQEKEIVSSNSNSSLYDSDIRTNKTCSLSPSNQRVEDIQIEDVQVEDVQVEDVQVEDVQIEDVQIEDIQIEDVQIEDVQIENVQIENVQIEDVQIEDVQIEDVQIEDVQIEDIQVEEPICTPRKISENLDIPQKMSGSPCISAHSKTSPNDNGEAWYSFVDTSSQMEIQLGSNPIISNFEMIAKSRGASSLENVADSDDKVLKIFENIVEEEEQNLAPENNSIEVVNQNEENKTHNKCNYLPSEEPSVSTPLKDDVKTPARTLSERDSANHSPISGVLEGSVTDEARSEGSTDSGKGGSIKGHTKDTVMLMTYEFCIPQSLVGRLIGRHGSFLQNIRHKAEVNIILKRHPILRDQKLCVIEGSTEGINVALVIIRQKFPEKKFPQLTLHQISPLVVTENVPWVAELRQLSLVEGLNNDVVICHIVKPNRLFVQLPTHPTYPSLRILDERMTQLYNTTESPPAPDKLTNGMILVAKWYNTWVRVYVERPDPNGEQHLVRLVDHGGYWVFNSSEMRKIRADYLMLPFQAIEVFLANIQPKNGEWSQEAFNTVINMCSGIVSQAQIEGYIDTNTYISLYVNIQKHGVISLADELIARGFAESIPLENIIPEVDISAS